jgi:predicted permease
MSGWLVSLWAAEGDQNVYTIICIGAFATWWGKFEKPARKGLNSLCKDLLLPCLLFAKVPAAVTLERLETWWILPVMSVIQVLFGLMSGWLVSLWAAEGDQNVKQFIMATVTFPNTTSFPLTLVSAMFLVVTFGNLSASDAVGESTALILVYTTFMNIERWTVGYSLLEPPEEPEDDSRKLKKHESEDVAEGTLTFGPNAPVSRPRGSSTLGTVEIKEMEVKKKPPAMSMSKRLKKSFNAPSITAVFAIILGIIPPIRDNIFAPGAIAKPAFTDAVKMVGNAYLCGIFLTLGGNLYTQLQSSISDGPTWKQIVGVIVARFMITPGCTYALVMTLWNHTDIMKGNALMAYVLMLESAGPTAVSLSTICQYFNNHEARISILLLYEYAAVIVSLTMWNTLFLMSLGAKSI